MEAGERKPVTVLFCDLVGSTALAERLDAEAVQSVQRAYFDRMRAAIEAFEGSVEKFIGDAVVAVFGVPQVHEDDAERAVRCGLAMQDALGGLNDTLRPTFGIELAVRIGINSGEAMVGVGSDAIATGDVVNTAARLEQAAEPGEILAGREAVRLTRAVVDYGQPRRIELKGKSEPVEAWPVQGLAEEPRRLRSPLIGRARELELLAAVLERAIVTAEPEVVVVLGDPGIGKSRLADEFAARAAGRAVVLRGSAPPYGEAVTWFALADAIRVEAGILESDAPAAALEKFRQRITLRHRGEEAVIVEAQLAPLIGARDSSVSSSSELLWALRRFFEALAGLAPTVLVLDDLHWASDTLLETLQELAETIPSGPLVLLLQGRPELRERLGSILAGERTNVVRLEALSDEDAQSLAASLISAGQERLASDLAESIAGRAEGNPLFLEEMAAMALEEGSAADVPQSLRALIAARLDLLPAEAKRLVQAAAVVGETFWDGAAAQLVDGSAAPLRLLRTRGLVEEDPGSTFLGQRQFRFHHSLIRDVAYESVPKRKRSDWHRFAADWLGAGARDRPELVVGIAHHLERAVALAVEVAPLEAPDRSLVENAARALARAGEWAASHGALAEALEPLRRAVDIAGDEPQLLAATQARLAHTLALAGEVEEAVTLAQVVVRTDVAGEAGALASLALAEAANDRGDGDGIREHGERSLALARAEGLRLVEASALEVLAWADLWTAHNLEAEEKWEEAARIALELNDHAVAARATGWRSLASTFRCRLYAAEEQADEAMRLARASGSMRALIAAHTACARSREFRGRPEEAVVHGREWLRLALDVGDPLKATAACVFGLAEPFLRLDELEEAWAVVEDGLRISEEMGGSAYASSLHVRRAQVLVRRGELDEAEAALGALELVSDETMVAVAAAAEGKLRLAQGRQADAERAWRTGMRQLGPEDVLLRVELQLDLGLLLAEQSRTEEARALAKEARATLDGSGADLFTAQLERLEGVLAERPTSHS